MKPRALFAASVLLFAPAAFARAPALLLDADTATDAIDRIRAALPDGWSTTDIHWDAVPFGWSGAPECLLVRIEDGSVRFPHPTADFDYQPFFKLWLLPVSWEGRMEVAPIDANCPYALYLGETEDFRVLYRTLGRNSWPDGSRELSRALGLASFPLTHSPRHTLDVDAMQALYRRLDTSARALERWQRQIYGIAELPELIYLELLTWDDRRESEDPTSLGDLAERETDYLSQQVLATFPSKRAVYLRRVTRETFSDVLVVNPRFASASSP